MDDPTILEMRLLLEVALTTGFFHSHGLSRQEALIVARATVFMLEEITRGKEAHEISPGLHELVKREIAELLAK